MSQLEAVKGLGQALVLNLPGLWSLLFFPAIPQSCWHLPSGDFLIKTFVLLSCGSSTFPSLMEPCQSHCGQEVRNGTPTLILHLGAQASQPQPGKPLAWKSGSSVPLPVRGLTDTWDLSWPMEQPQMCCSLAWQCIVYLQAWPTQLGWGDALEGKECFTLSKLLPSFCKSLSPYFFPRDQRVHFAYSVISL